MSEDEAELDAAIVQTIADGASIKAAAKLHGVSRARAREAQQRALIAFSDGESLRLEWMLERKRLLACSKRFYTIAMRDNDPTAAAVFAKLSERRASLHGANAPAATAVHLITSSEPQRQLTSTDKIEAVLNRLIASRPKPPSDDESEPNKPN